MINFGDVTKAAGGNINLNSVIPVEMMMILGSYRFCLRNAAYQTLKRTTEYDWQEQRRIGAGPALQHVGQSADAMELEGVIYPHFRGGLRQAALMRAEAGLGVPMFLISGNGTAFGRWCILSVAETQSFFMKDGGPRKIEFSLSLKKYGETQAAGALGVVQKIAGAL